MDAAFPTPAAPTPPVEPPGRPHALEAGLTIGDFRIVRLLGSGGMGIVYLARQVSLDRPVALKIMGPALNRDSDIARFRREAQAVARLRHPGIAGVYFIGQDRLISYLAMEYIEGASLRKLIERLASGLSSGQTLDSVLATLPIGEGEAPVVRLDEATVTYSGGPPGCSPPIDPDGPTPAAKATAATPAYVRRCVELIRDAASALAHAHGLGVIHRDIKPENILMDREGRVHLIDFGLARFLEDVTLTNSGALVGTPMYMSPEQVSGRLDVDARTDVYSLGLVLYELLALRRPIAAPTREGVLRQVATKALVPVTWHNRAVPRAIEDVVHKATAKDPDERHRDAAELAGDLQACLDGRATTAPPYRYRFDRREIVASRPRPVTFAAVLHLMLATFWLTYGFFYFGAYFYLYSDSGAYRTFMAFALLLFTAMITASAALGVGLLHGRGRARRASVAFDLVAAASLVYPLSQALFSRHLMPGFPTWFLVVAVLALLAAIVALVASAWVLRGPGARRWFLFAERAVAEYRGRGVPSGS